MFRAGARHDSTPAANPSGCPGRRPRRQDVSGRTQFRADAGLRASDLVPLLVLQMIRLVGRAQAVGHAVAQVDVDVALALRERARTGPDRPCFVSPSLRTWQFASEESARATDTPAPSAGTVASATSSLDDFMFAPVVLGDESRRRTDEGPHRDQSALADYPESERRCVAVRQVRRMRSTGLLNCVWTGTRPTTTRIELRDGVLRRPCLARTGARS